MKMVTHQLVAMEFNHVREFYGDVSNLKRISPPFPQLTIDATDTRVAAGKEFILTLDFILFKFIWLSKIEEVVDGEYFVDSFRGSVFKVWRHTHAYKAIVGGTLLTDEVEFTPALWIVPFAFVCVKMLFVFRRSAIDRVLR